MTLMTCYDPEGKAHCVEAVDAREYLKSGYYTSEPPVEAAIELAVAEPVAQPVVDVESVAVAEPDADLAQPKAKPGPKPKA